MKNYLHLLLSVAFGLLAIAGYTQDINVGFGMPTADVDLTAGVYTPNGANPFININDLGTELDNGDITIINNSGAIIFAGGSTHSRQAKGR